jgi:hypothetical protein
MPKDDGEGEAPRNSQVIKRREPDSQLMNVSSANVMANVLSEGRIERQKAADERASGRLRDAQSAVAALKKMNASASDQKKAAAKQRVDQLKARLEMLKMTSPLDPKALAPLARELESAVSSYADAGGASGDLGVTAMQAVAAAPTDFQVSVNAEGGADTHIQTAPKGPTSNGAYTDEDEKDSLSDGKTEPVETNPYQRVAREAQGRFAEASRRGAAAQADRAFLTDVRGLASQIKASAKHAATQNGGLHERRHADEADEAAEAIKAINDAAKALNVGGGVSLTI